MVNILAADKLMQSPRLYATFLLWMLSELFESCPRPAIRRNPSWCSSSMRPTCCSTMRRGADGQDRAVVRLIRSKGVGVYFVTQKPVDVPDTVLSSSATRAARVAGVHRATRRRWPPPRRRSGPIRSSTRQVIMELGKGEALVSFLEGNGTPAMVERVMVRPPRRDRPGYAEERKAIIDSSPFKGKYDTAIDAESAYEILQKRVAEPRQQRRSGGGILGQIGSIVGTIFGTNVPRGRLSTGQVIARSVTRSVTTRWSAGWLPISANRSAARWAVRSPRAGARPLGGLLRR